MNAKTSGILCYESVCLSYVDFIGHDNSWYKVWLDHFSLEHLLSEVYAVTVPHNSAHSLLRALFCFPLCVCVTGFLLFFFGSLTDGTRLDSASCCWWLRSLLLLLYKELLSRSRTVFPIDFSRRLLNRPKTPVLPALPFAFRDWWPLEFSVPVWKLKISWWLWSQRCVYFPEILCIAYLSLVFENYAFWYITHHYNKLINYGTTNIWV